MLDRPDVAHPKAPRHGNGPGIARVDQADEALRMQVRLRRGDGSPSTFGGEPPALERLPERPSDLDLACESVHEVGMRGPDPSTRIAGRTIPDHPQSEAMHLPVVQVVLEAHSSMPGVEGLAGAKGLPHIPVGPDGQEAVLVLRAGTSQVEPGGLDDFGKGQGR
jgi:hypothetical protein